MSERKSIPSTIPVYTPYKVKKNKYTPNSKGKVKKQ